MPLSTSASSPTTDTQQFDTALSQVPAYKGKCKRSWVDLPPEILRVIATTYMVTCNQNAPQHWMQHDQWGSHAVFQVLCDAWTLEVMMSVCTKWFTALESHPFWSYACMTFDPHYTLAQHAVIHPKPNSANSATTVIRLSSYRHFRNMSRCSCAVCRINMPYSSIGLASAKRSVHIPRLGWVGLCRVHKLGTSYCGICLRTESQGGEMYSAGIAENEDPQTWPSVEATCRVCRAGALWARVRDNESDAVAVGAIDGTSWDGPDWEVRQAVDTFIALGEGAVTDVIVLGREKAWLRHYTRLAEMMSNAMAAARLQARIESGEAEDDDTYSDDSYDSDVLAISEEAESCKELALNDWARRRILDGHWFAPADSWYRNLVPGHGNSVPAHHPVPWTIDDKPDLQEHHPRRTWVNQDVPPTFSLCEQAYRAYSQQMKMILLPAMSNIVRRLVIECSADGVDAAVKASQLTLEEILHHLRDDGTWYNGIDWLQKRANEMKAVCMDVDKDKCDDDASSEGTDATSPVLSTSTLQTTPSPEPSKDELSPTTETTPVIPVHPVREVPVLLNTIPYVPETFAHLPHYSTTVIQQVWRDACLPLYHCRCNICIRGMAKTQDAQPAPAPVPVASKPSVADSPTAHPPHRPGGDEDPALVSQGGEGRPELEQPLPRKRSREALETVEPGPDPDERGTTPPKRARTEQEAATPTALPPRLRQHGLPLSQEEVARVADAGAFKRQKTIGVGVEATSHE